MFPPSNPIRGFQPTADRVRPESPGVGRALLGISPRTLREVLSSNNRSYTTTLRIIAA